MKRQRSIENELASAGFVQPSKTVTAVFADGSKQRFIFNTDLPVICVEEDEPVPHFPASSQTEGPREFYEPTNRLVLNKRKLLVKAANRVPPLQVRTKHNRLKVWANYVPEPGDTVGFIAGSCLTYAGLTVSRKIHLFRLDDDLYCPLTRILDVLATGGDDGAPMTSRAKSSLRYFLGRSERAIMVNSGHDDIYDTMVMLKLIGAVAMRSRQQTLVLTADVDTILAECGHGYTLDWTLEKNGSGAQK